MRDKIKNIEWEEETKNIHFCQCQNPNQGRDRDPNPVLVLLIKDLLIININHQGREMTIEEDPEAALIMEETEGEEIVLDHVQGLQFMNDLFESG